MMTTPNAYTRTSLVDISARTTTALTELDRLLPHMRAVANTATGSRAVLAQRAVAEAEALREQLTVADKHAETVKTLFRSATLSPGVAEREEVRGTACLPPGALPALHSSPAPMHLGGGAAALMRRQV